MQSARRDLYRILGGVLEDCPNLGLLKALAEDSALESLAEHFGRDLGDALRSMHLELRRGEEARKAIRRDYVALFIGPRKKRAPPWESAYRSPERLVAQQQEREVVKAYAAERVGFDGIGSSRPADHVALELQFVALLLERARRSKNARPALRSFLDGHLLRWVPAFAADVRKHARTEFMRALGRTLEALCAIEVGPARRPRLAVVRQ